MESLIISKNEDWSKLRERELMTIVDPMIFRTADLFIGGKSSCINTNSNVELTWETINKNIGALIAFFDGIILRQQLPIISYESTFRESQLLDLNDDGHFLVPIIVNGDVYEQSKASAIHELRNRKAILPNFAKDILKELTSYGYAWQPGLDELGQLSPENKILKTFLLGGLLFGGYAQQLSSPLKKAEHILQPKTSRLFLMATLGMKNNETTTDSTVLKHFDDLTKNISSEAIKLVKLPSVPTFLPLLLRHRSNPKTPRELFQLALEWREQSSVKEFRNWYQKIETQLDQNYYDPEVKKELAQIRNDISEKLGHYTDESITLSANIGTDLGLGLEKAVNLRRIKWFFQELLPRYSYRKLFQRMIITQSSYTDLTKHLGMLWHKQ